MSRSRLIWSCALHVSAPSLPWSFCLPDRGVLEKFVEEFPNGEPAHCGLAPLPSRPPLASTSCYVRDVDHRVNHLLRDVGDAVRPRAEAGAEMRTLAAPSVPPKSERGLTDAGDDKGWDATGHVPITPKKRRRKLMSHSGPERGHGAAGVPLSLPCGLHIRECGRATHDDVITAAFF